MFKKIYHSIQTDTSKYLIYFTFFVIYASTMIEWLIQSQHRHFWMDETLIVYMANHIPFSNEFFVALKGMVHALPWPFVEYWWYLQLLKDNVPMNHLMANLELYLRFPLLIYISIVVFSTFIISKRLSGSRAFAVCVAVFLFLLNTMTAQMGTEFRHHTSGFAHGALSWMLLTLLLTTDERFRIRRHVYLFLWTVSAIIAGTSHIYSTYTVFLQIFIFVLANHNLIPNLSLSKVNSFIKTVCLLLVYGIGIFQGLFIRFFLGVGSLSGGRQEVGGIPSGELLSRALNSINDLVLIPSIWIWIILFLSVGVIKLVQSKKWSVKFQYSVMFAFGLAQIALMFLLATKHIKAGYGPDHWMGRYLYAAMVPFIFSLSYFLNGTIKDAWERKWGKYVAVIGLIIFIAFPKCNNVFHGNSEGLAENSRWVQVKKQLLALDAYGKVNYVLGLEPNHSHAQQFDIHGQAVSQTWQLYTGGPFSIARISEHKNPFGGRKGLPCKIRALLPVGAANAREYAVDFCEKDKAIIRAVNIN